MGGGWGESMLFVGVDKKTKKEKILSKKYETTRYCDPCVIFHVMRSATTFDTL